MQVASSFTLPLPLNWRTTEILRALQVSPLTFFAVFSDTVPENWKTVSCEAAEKISGEGTQTCFIMPKSEMETNAAAFQGTERALDSHNLWIVRCIVYRDSLDGGMQYTVVPLRSPVGLFTDCSIQSRQSRNLRARSELGSGIGPGTASTSEFRGAPMQ